jgi:SAM-dependent methyltransferase
MATLMECGAQRGIYVRLGAMADWQRQIWDDITAVDGIVPPDGGSVLVIGSGLPVVFEDGVRVVRRGWGEAFGDEAGFERIVILAGGDLVVDYALVLGQVWRLLRPDGLLVVVAARPSPWGLRRTVWWRGYPLWRWVRWLRAANWLVADRFTAGFGSRWLGWIPDGGVVRVILAQKRVGGMKILAHTPKGVLVKPVGMPI